MKQTQLNLKDLIEKLRSQQLLKKDMVVPKSCLQMEDGKMQIINVQGNSQLQELLMSTGISADNSLGERILTLEVQNIAHRQIATKLAIPWNYYEVISQDKFIECLDFNVNFWLSKQPEDTTFLIRTFIDKVEENGIMRALLSDRFKIIDHYDVLLSALDVISQTGVKIDVHSADLTDSRMYVRFDAPGVIEHSKALLDQYRTPGTSGNGDDGITAGFILTNSEVGQGTFNISPRLIIRTCSNGAIMRRDALKRVHLGQQLEEYSAIEWSEETKEQNMKLIISQTKDAVKTFLSPEYLGKAVRSLEEVGGHKLQHPVDAIKNVSKELAYSEDKEKAILEYFMQGATNTMFGITQALTFYAHKDANPDEQFDMEGDAVSILAPEKVKVIDKPFTSSRRKKVNTDFRSN